MKTQKLKTVKQNNNNKKSDRLLESSHLETTDLSKYAKERQILNTQRYLICRREVVQTYNRSTQEAQKGQRPVYTTQPKLSKKIKKKKKPGTKKRSE